MTLIFSTNYTPNLCTCTRRGLKIYENPADSDGYNPRLWPSSDQVQKPYLMSGTESFTRFMVMHGLEGLAILRSHKRRRVSSYDRTGGNRDFIVVPAGETAVLAEMEGPGKVNHIWVTIRSKEEWYLRKLVLRAYWDGEKEPSVMAPIGDFFGIGHGMHHNYVSAPMQMQLRLGPDADEPRGRESVQLLVAHALRGRGPDHPGESGGHGVRGVLLLRGLRGVG
jgi:hypothetical protein